jgi:undecaprenyl-diphosphatase
VRKLLLALTATLLAPLALAAAEPAARSPEPGAPAAELSITDALVLGVVEGVTEFLPISSTGHLIIANRVLGLESDQPLKDAAGRPLWFKPPAAERKDGRLTAAKRWLLRLVGRDLKVEQPEGVPLTLNLAANTYTIVIQFGAIAAVGLLYWPQLLSMVRGLRGRDAAGLKLFVNLLIAFLPAAAVGLLAKDWIDDHLFTVGPVIVAQVAGAGLMLFAERWRRRHIKLQPDDVGLDNLAPHAAAGIGLLQCVSLWPGTSRSMMVIVGGYFAGLSVRRSAEFSFLLGFVTLSAATALKSYTGGAAMIAVFGWPHVLLGAVVAAVTAALCVRWLVGWLTRHGLAAFAYYRLALAALLAVVFYL